MSHVELTTHVPAVHLFSITFLHCLFVSNSAFRLIKCIGEFRLLHVHMCRDVNVFPHISATIGASGRIFEYRWTTSCATISPPFQSSTIGAIYVLTKSPVSTTKSGHVRTTNIRLVTDMSINPSCNEEILHSRFWMHFQPVIIHYITH